METVVGLVAIGAIGYGVLWVVMKMIQASNESFARNAEAASSGPEKWKSTADSPWYPEYLSILREVVPSGEKIEAVFDCTKPAWREPPLSKGGSNLELLAVTPRRVIRYEWGSASSIPYKSIESVTLGAPVAQDGTFWRRLDIRVHDGPYSIYLYQGDGQLAHDSIMRRIIIPDRGLAASQPYRQRRAPAGKRRSRPT